MANSGAFGFFAPEKGIGIKRYTIGAETIDPGILAHAWTERCMLESITKLCDEFDGPLTFLGDHMAKFKAAWIAEIGEKRGRGRPPKRTEEEKLGAKGQCCLGMELVSGSELACKIESRGFEEGKTVKICCELIRTLALLHEIGVSHRDLKMDNVMVKNDGTTVLIDWGTASCGKISDSKTVCGTRRANSMQQIAIEAQLDGDLPNNIRSYIFKRKKPSYDVMANDLVQLAHILTAMWSAHSTGRTMVCGAFGPEWDEISTELSAKDSLKYLKLLYSSLEELDHIELIPEPFRTIILQLVHPAEEERISCISAWHMLWKKRTFVGFTGKTYDMRMFLPKPPTSQSFEKYRARLQELITLDAGYTESDISAKELLERWEYSSPTSAVKTTATTSAVKTTATTSTVKTTGAKTTSAKAESRKRPRSDKSCEDENSMKTLRPTTKKTTIATEEPRKRRRSDKSCEDENSIVKRRNTST